MQRQQNLTKNQKIVLDIIEKSTEPLKAYSILSNVKKKGINAPPQVYRALDKLVDMGKYTKLKVKMLSLPVKIQIVKFQKLQHFQSAKAVRK